MSGETKFTAIDSEPWPGKCEICGGNIGVRLIAATDKYQLSCVNAFCSNHKKISVTKARGESQ